MTDYVPFADDSFYRLVHKLSTDSMPSRCFCRVSHVSGARRRYERVRRAVVQRQEYIFRGIFNTSDCQEAHLEFVE